LAEDILEYAIIAGRCSDLAMHSGAAIKMSSSPRPAYAKMANLW